MQSSSRFALRPQARHSRRDIKQVRLRNQETAWRCPDSRRSPGSGEQPSSRCYARGAKSVHEFDWALRADEEPLTVVELKLDALVPAHVVSFPIPTIANAPAAIFPKRAVGSGFRMLDGVDRKSQERPVEWKETKIETVASDLGHQTGTVEQQRQSNTDQHPK